MKTPRVFKLENLEKATTQDKIELCEFLISEYEKSVSTWLCSVIYALDICPEFEDRAYVDLLFPEYIDLTFFSESFENITNEYIDRRNYRFFLLEKKLRQLKAQLRKESK